MTLLLDTATDDGAHKCGYIGAHDVNSDARLRIYAEFGGLTITLGAGRTGTTIELSGEELEALLDALRSYQARERMAAYGEAA